MNDTTTNPVRRRKSSGARKAIAAAVVVVLAGGGWYGWQKYKANANKEGEYLTAKIETGDIEDLVTSTGTLQPREFVDVGAQVSGQIEKLYVEVGDVVQQGDVLAEIDATTAIAKVDGLKASLLSAETNLITQTTNRDKAKRDYQRQQNLLAADATTKETELNAKTSYENAERQIIVSEAQIAQQKANLRIEERNLGYTSITAPQSGTVMKVSVKQGQTVNASQNVPIVMQIANLTTMTVQSEVSEADMAKVHVGMPVYFTTLSGNNRRWYGELKRIEPTPKVQNNVVLYNALFDIENDSGDLRPSMTAQVYFMSAEAKGVLIMPMAAIQQGQQIAREIAQKEREKNGKAGTAGGPAGAPPGAMGAPGAAPGAGGAAAANTAAGAREGAPAAVAANSAATGAGSAPAAAASGEGSQANRPNGQGNRPGGQSGNRQANAQGMRGGGGGNFGGQRPGGGQGGFNPQSMTPEQREQMMTRMRGQGGGIGQRPGGMGFGQRGGSASNAATAAGPRPVQPRTGTVMVKNADGTLEARRVVYGVTNRVHAQVLEGLKEGEEVIVGKSQTEAAAAARPTNTNNNNNFQNNRGGGGNFQGGRPF